MKMEDFSKRTLLAPAPKMRGEAEMKRKIVGENWKENCVKTAKEFGKLHYHERMGFGKKYIAGVDPYEIKEKLVKCPECNGRAKCEYCSGVGTLPEEAHLYKAKELRSVKETIRLMVEPDKNYLKVEKMSYEELMDIYKRGAPLPRKAKNKYAVKIAVYERDGDEQMAGGIFKGDKIIYYTRKRWQMILLIRIIAFFSIDECYMMFSGTKDSDYEKIINYESKS